MRSRLTYANVMSTLAAFIALGGVSWAAATLPRNSVGPTQLRANAVTSGKIANGTVKAVDIAPGVLRIGPTGPAGARGDTGPAGAAGRDASAGQQGPAGLDGEAGPTGERGPSGDQGPKGDRGDTGRTGGPCDLFLCPNTAMPSGSAVLTIDGHEIATFDAYQTRCDGEIVRLEVDEIPRNRYEPGACTLIAASDIGTNLELDAWHAALRRNAANGLLDFGFDVRNGGGTRVARYFVTKGGPQEITNQNGRQQVVFGAAALERTAP